MKKIFLFIALCTVISVHAQSKNGKPVSKSTIKGTLLYEVSLINIIKPDAGATVMIHKTDVKKESAKDFFTSFRKIIAIKELYEMTRKEEYLKGLQNANADTPEKFKILDDAATDYFDGIKKDPNTIMAITDKAGSYSVELKPGRYEVILKSVGISSYSNTLETTGRIYNYFIEVKSGETIIQDHTFKA